MVSYADVINNNESLKDAGSGLTAAFLGATAGIGLAALNALAKHTASPTIYIVGRAQPKLDSIIADLKTLNATGTYHPIIASDLTLASNARAAAEQITKSPGISKIDILIMSPGFISFTGPHLTAEKLESCQTVRYYSRLLFLQTLLPLLRASPSPRVISVLGSGREGKVFTSDWQLSADHGANFGVFVAAGHTAGMKTLYFEEMAKQPGNEKMVLIHLYPGFVTGTSMDFRNGGTALNLFLNWVVKPMMALFGYSAAEAGERVLFAATSGRFRRIGDEAERQRTAKAGSLVQKGSDGRVGSGVYLVQQDGSVMPGNKALDASRKDGVPQMVWRHTLDVFEGI